MGGFLGGLGTILGGFNTARRIDEEGFDFREKAEQEEWERQRRQEMARQADEDRGINLASQYLVGGGEPSDEFSAQAFGPEVNQARQKFLVGAATGRGAQARSSLEAQKYQNQYYRDLFKQTGAERLVGLRGAEAQELAKLRADLAAGMPESPAQKARRESLENMNAAQIAAMDRRTAAGGVGGGGVPKPVYDTEEKREVMLTPEQLRAAPPGRYISSVTGRLQEGEETASGSMDILTKQADAVLRRYEQSSIFSPLEKAAAWSQYQSVIGSLGQVLGRSVLRDQRVSQQDREVYTNTIGLTSFILAELAPNEARKRLDLLLRLKNEATSGIPYATSTAAREAEQIISEEYGGREGATQTAPNPWDYDPETGGQ